MIEVKPGTALTFGEIMLRLSPPRGEKFLQSPKFDVVIGGGEANVAISLANFGIDTQYVTILPPNALGDAIVRTLKAWSVDTSKIIRQGERVGLWFLEIGSGPRPSKVIYDRTNSAIASCQPEDFQWEEIFEGVAWFHVSGITPAISQSAADATITALETAKKLGIVTSCDLNYRAKLWKYGKTAPEIMDRMMPYVDVVIANEEDIQNSLGIAPDQKVGGGSLQSEDYEFLTAQVLDNFPNVSLVAITLRESFSAENNRWSAVCRVNGEDEVVFSKKYDLQDITDRVGGGDAFAGGLIYGLISKQPIAESIEFAVAASALKHTIFGDYNQVTIEEVNALRMGEASGRVQR